MKLSVREYYEVSFFFLTNDTIVVSLMQEERRPDMDITIKYMLRPVAHCKEGCSSKSRA